MTVMLLPSLNIEQHLATIPEDSELEFRSSLGKIVKNIEDFRMTISERYFRNAEQDRALKDMDVAIMELEEECSSISSAEFSRRSILFLPFDVLSITRDDTESPEASYGWIAIMVLLFIVLMSFVVAILVRVA